jgi:hypothetical protein
MSAKMRHFVFLWRIPAHSSELQRVFEAPYIHGCMGVRYLPLKVFVQMVALEVVNRIIGQGNVARWMIPAPYLLVYLTAMRIYNYSIPEKQTPALGISNLPRDFETLWT